MRSVWVGLGLGLMLLWGKGLRGQEEARPEFYVQHVRPIFQDQCFRCHGGMNHRGGLNMSTRAGMYKGGKDGAVLVPGDPGKSLMVKAIRHEGQNGSPKPMPEKSKLSDADIGTIERWIRAGAIMPVDVPKP